MLGSLLYTLHVVAAVLWVGGMAFAILVLRPALAAIEPPQRLLLHAGVFRRFFLIVWHAMPIILISGWLLLFFWYGGFRGAGWHVHLMHLSGLAMAAVFALLFTGPYRSFRAAMARGDTAFAAGAADRVRRLVQLNLALGLATVAVAAWGRFPG
jgi:uncharacterized membrane protein